MTDIEKLKLLTGESDDKLLSLLLEDATEFVLAYTGRSQIVTGMEKTVRDLAVIALNRMGTEGESSRSAAVLRACRNRCTTSWTGSGWHGWEVKSMRQKRSRLRKYYHRGAIPKKDNEGSSYIEYDDPVAFTAEEWAAGGKLQAEMYGQRLPNIRNLRVTGEYREMFATGGPLGYQIENGPLFHLGDGVCLYVGPEAEPDYKVVAIYPHRLLTLEVEHV